MEIKKVKIDQCTIEIGSLAASSFSELLSTRYSKSRKIILVDENVHDACLEYLITQFDELTDAEVMLLPPGEENKVMEVCMQVWYALSEYGIVRSDLVINLGGGVVTDMGGFIASLFKRGLDFIHIPTSLLGMVDASIGGKTGIDLGPYKNQLGVFQHPVAIYIDAAFLGTLPDEEFVSGYAEMLKHALIADKNHWKELTQTHPLDLKEANLFQPLIARSVEIKAAVVNSDFTESGPRKTLNFGHTVGHAIEGFCLQREPVAHGHAIGIGMIAEAWLSHKKGNISNDQLNEIVTYLAQLYPEIELNDEEIPVVLDLLKHDKKNSSTAIRTVLLTDIGASEFDVNLTEDEVKEALIYVRGIYAILNSQLNN